MPGARFIDKDERTRQKPMRVLVLGMPRTGTTGVCAALRRLGYTPHQMREILVNPSEITLWQEAVDVTLVPAAQRPAKKRDLPVYGREEFDKLLGEYDVVADLPGALFAKELIEAYPNAKVILTWKKYEDWVRSMRDSIWLLLTWRLFIITRILNITQVAPLTRLVHSLFHVHNGLYFSGPNARDAYDEHNESVRSLVDENQLLEIGPDTEMDWGRLCTFLEVDKPKDVQYPQMEEGGSMKKGLQSAWVDVAWYCFTLVMFVGIAIFGLGFLYWQGELWASFEGWLKKLGPYARIRGEKNRDEL